MKANIVLILSAMVLFLSSCNGDNELVNDSLPPDRNDVYIYYQDIDGNNLIDNTDLDLDPDLENIYPSFMHPLKEGTYKVRIYINGEPIIEEDTPFINTFVQKSSISKSSIYIKSNPSPKNDVFWKNHHAKKDFVFKYIISIPKLLGEEEHELIIYKKYSDLGGMNITSAIYNGEAIQSTINAINIVIE